MVEVRALHGEDDDYPGNESADSEDESDDGEYFDEDLYEL